MSSMYDEMKKFEDRGTIKINKGADTIYELLGYDNPKDMLAESLINPKLGALLALETILIEMGAKNVILFISFIAMTTQKAPTHGIGDIMEYMNDNFNEKQVVEFVGRAIQAREMFDIMKKGRDE